MRKSFKYLLVLFILVALFLSYNFNLYSDKSNYGSVHLSDKAIKGENLWIQNNCNSCHQIYGLGGYLGPDLTNVYSANGKGEIYIKAFLNSGIKAMPKFNFNETEKEDLVQFLKEVDQTGYFPNVEAKIKKDGWVDLKYKNATNGEQ